MKLSKISLFINTLEGGGAERVMLNLSRGLADKGLQVDLLLMRAQGQYLKDVPANVNLIGLKSRRAILSLPKIIKYLRSNKPEILLSNLDAANVIALLAKRLSGVDTKIVVNETCNLSRKNWTKKWRYRIMPFVIKVTYPWASAIFAKSEGVRKDILNTINISANKVFTVPNPVISPEFYEIAENNVDHPWFKNKDIPMVIGVGRFDELKNFQDLLKAFSMVRKEVCARLIILGEGRQRKELTSLAKALGIENDVCLPGFKNNPFKYMKQSSVFVLTSKEEGFGLVVVEALACGCKVVSTDCDGPKEILENGKWGSIVPVGDIEAIAEAIKASLNRTQSSEGVLRASKYEIKSATNEILEILTTL